MKRKLFILFPTVILISILLYGCFEKGSSNSNSKNIDSPTISDVNNKETTKSSADKNDVSLAFGALAAKEDNNLTNEKMLTYAMQDEYLAKKEYELIMDKYGEQKPFSNIIEAEKTHISQLTELFNTYKITIPEDNSESYAILPKNLEDAYKTGVTAEIDNIAMYDKFLKEELPQDIKDTFISLRDASKKHLAAFQNKIN